MMCRCWSSAVAAARHGRRVSSALAFCSSAPAEWITSRNMRCWAARWRWKASAKR
jgi:hypothetical protein